jgi:diguanylate cyclase (GGDEF)-like protein/putative nucleotidyltransferase with HDIG domain
MRGGGIAPRLGTVAVERSVRALMRRRLAAAAILAAPAGLALLRLGPPSQARIHAPAVVALVLVLVTLVERATRGRIARASGSERREAALDVLVALLGVSSLLVCVVAPGAATTLADAVVPLSGAAVLGGVAWITRAREGAGAPAAQSAFALSVAAALVALGVLARGLLGDLPVLAGALAVGALLATLCRVLLALDDVRRAHREAEAARAAAERSARVDPLTGVHNRRHLAEVLANELRRSAEAGVRPALVVLDLDHFKRVNDAFGHEAGDRVLVETARRLGAAVRPYDCVARYGGEEFCVLFVGDHDQAALEARAEELRLAIGGTPFDAGCASELWLTCSIGAALPDAGSWAGAPLMRDADRALYAAKRAGRDRVVLASSLAAGEVEAGDGPQLRVARALALSAAIREGAPPLHCKHVSELAARIAARLALAETAVERCRLAGVLHDVGKVAIPDHILGKRGPLDLGEWQAMRAHSILGEQLVRQMEGFAEVAAIVRQHHERVDGRGYPDALEGSAIAIEARVVAAADAFVSMTGDRVYRRASSHTDALAELRAVAGAHLDPAVVEALCDVLEGERLEIARRLGLVDEAA